MEFKKAQNKNNCIIVILNYIIAKAQIQEKMIKIKYKIMLNDKIYTELYYYALFISFLSMCQN